jgi:6-pyruvoyltetrahydropterin/6-carboxytetrahydropterin synthase
MEQQTTKFRSKKLFDGYSACFRQWKADDTHCKFLHGYAISFEVEFEGELDARNWVFDFGGMRRAKHHIKGFSPKDYFDWLFDHTVIISKDDPFKDDFNQLDLKGVIQLRVLDFVGCERFAEHLYIEINKFLEVETEGRVQAIKVTVFENQKNSASFSK